MSRSIKLVKPSSDEKPLTSPAQKRVYVKIPTKIVLL